MAEAAEQRAKIPSTSRPERETATSVPGVAAANVLDALKAARDWCNDRDPEVSILIINWNAGQLTRECVRQIWANTAKVRYEILIIDNGSAPEGLAFVNPPGTGIRLLTLGINRFFGEANNIG